MEDNKVDQNAEEKVEDLKKPEEEAAAEVEASEGGEEVVVEEEASEGGEEVVA